MYAMASAAVLVGALALFVAGFPATATAQTSAAPLRQQEPTGLLDGDEAREVARALDEAELEIGRTIHVDVIVDPNGRRVSTDWFAPVSMEGVGQATEVPLPVLAEDVNAPDGVVVLVDPFEGTGSFVEAPGLPDGDERYLSGVMTSEFRSGSYDDGLIAVAHGLEDRLAHSRPAYSPPAPLHREAAKEPAVSFAAVVLFAGGTAAVVLLLGLFLRGEGYRAPRGPDRGVGFVAARRDAEALLAALAPRVMLLAERERVVIGRLRDFGETMPDGPNRRRAEALLRQTVCGGFWEDFVAATALAEEDPEGALPDLRRLSAEVVAALGKLGEAGEALQDPRAEKGPRPDGERLTRRDENYG